MANLKTSQVSANLPSNSERAKHQRTTRRQFGAAKKELDALLLNNRGSYPHISIRLASGVSDGETITIGDEIYEFDTDDELTTGGIAVDVSGGATAAAAGTAFVAAFNASTNYNLVAKKISDNEVVVVQKEDAGPDPSVLSDIEVSETMAGSNNTIDSSFLNGNRAGGARQYSRITRVPTAQEVALGTLHVFLAFAPAMVKVSVFTTATGETVSWDGAVTKVAASGGVPDYVTLDNSGNTDWATTSTIVIEAYE